MNVLALDIASIVGACDGAVGSKPRLWTWNLFDAGDTRPRRFLALAALLRRYLEQNPCDGVVYEAPLPLSAMHKLDRFTRKVTFLSNDDAVAFALGAQGVVELVCAEQRKPVKPLPVQPARQAVLGWARNIDKVWVRDRMRPLTTKERVLRDVTEILKVPAENDNEADAYVLWAYAAALQNPRLAVAMTPLFRDPPTPMEKKP